MAKLKYLLLFVICLVILLASLAFIMKNDSPVVVDFFVFRFSDISIGIWLMMSFILGGFLGLVVRVPGAVWSSARFRVQSRKLAKQSEQLKRLEQEPSKVV